MIEKPPYHGAVKEHVRLLNSSRDIAFELIKDPRIQKAAVPILLHHDLHKRNIFVSEDNPTIVTDIIDWQSSSIIPALMHANEVPDFAAHIYATEDHDPPEAPPTRNNANLCNRAYVAGVQLLIPKLSSTLELDDDIIRFSEYCQRTYRDGAGVFRQVLIDLAKRWQELKLTGSCPYSLPTSKDLVIHQEEYKDLERVQELRNFVISRLNIAADGWVPTEAWEETVENHEKLYEKFRKTMEDEELKKVWPFDLPSSIVASSR